MKKRCLNPDEGHLKYLNVPICKEWVDSFLAFLTDMGNKPTPKHSIDRIDNSRGYEKGNCRWATTKEQNRNYSQNRIIEYRGIKMCVTEWAEMLSIDRHRIYQRINRGWSIEKSITHNLTPDSLKLLGKLCNS